MKKSSKTNQRASRPWPAEKIQHRSLDSLVPASGNPRIHAKADVDRLAEMISRFGWTMPILCDEAGTIIAGELRALAGRKLGLKEVPVIVARNWTEQEKRAYRIADNQLTLRGSWDPQLLGIEMDWLKTEGFKLDMTGFDPAEQEAILKDARPGGLTDPDATPEVPTEAVSRLGDIWKLDNHRVACGDSTVKDTVARLLGDAKPLLMVTDPPYGVNYDPSWREGQDLGVGKRSKGKVLNDDRASWREAYALFEGDVAYVWHGGLHSHEVAADLAACRLVPRAQIIWAKQHFALSRGHYHWQHEPCWYAVREGANGHWAGDRKQCTLWEIANNNSFGNSQPEKTWGHGTQKPVECMRRPIVNNSRAGDVIYDPFLGAGTLVISAEMTGRICLGIELNPAYVDVIIRRWEEFTGRKAVLAGSDQPFDEVRTSRHSSRGR